MKVPELLVRSRKFNQMEIEMDKFLAKKNPIFKLTDPDKTGPEQISYQGLGLAFADVAVRYKINGTVLQLTLKSMYEHCRKMVFNAHSFQ